MGAQIDGGRTSRIEIFSGVDVCIGANPPGCDRHGIELGPYHACPRDVLVAKVRTLGRAPSTCYRPFVKSWMPRDRM